MCKLKNVATLFVLSFVFMIERSSASDDLMRHDFRTFLDSMTKEPGFKPCEAFFQFTKSCLKDYTSESFSEVLKEDKVTKEGFVTLQLKFPILQEVLVQRFTTGQDLDTQAFYDPKYSEMPKTYVGLLSSHFSSVAEQNLLTLSVKLYTDKRQSRVINLWRTFLPTKLQDIDAKGLDTYICSCLTEIMAELLVQAKKPEEFDHPLIKQIRLIIYNQLLRKQQELGRLLTETARKFPMFRSGFIRYSEEKGADTISVADLHKFVHSYNENTKPPSIGSKISEMFRFISLFGNMNTNSALTSFSDVLEKNEEQGTLHFALGDSNLPLYYARFKGLDAENQELEAAHIMRDLFEYIPFLIRIQGQEFIEATDLKNLEQVMAQQKSRIHKTLVSLDMMIDDFMPGTKRENPPQPPQVSLSALKLKSESPVQNRTIQMLLTGLFAKQVFAAFLAKLEIPGYPRIIYGADQLYLDCQNSDQFMHMALDLCKLRLPEYKAKMLHMPKKISIAYHEGFKRNAIFMEPIPRNPSEKMGVLAVWSELVLKIFSTTARESSVDIKMYSKFLAQLNQQILRRLEWIIKALRIPGADNLSNNKGYFKSNLIPLDRIVKYIEILSTTPRLVLALLEWPKENVKLYQMIRDLKKGVTFDIYQEGTLRFLAEKKYMLSSDLLAEFSRWYLIAYWNNNDPAIKPLGNTIDGRLAGFLSSLIIQSVRPRLQESIKHAHDTNDHQKTIDTLMAYHKSLNDFDFSGDF